VLLSFGNSLPLVHAIGKRPPIRTLTMDIGHRFFLVRSNILTNKSKALNVVWTERVKR